MKYIVKTYIDRILFTRLCTLNPHWHETSITHSLNPSLQFT
jgi:hypothetical protein